MLYKQNHTPRLDAALFKNPTSEYRGTPFWAWNCKLDPKELAWQLEVFKKMGFGGAHMHVRTGMATPYLSDEYMNLIKGCVAKAKSENMLAWLYDEDRWPSGAAGGFVTREKRYRARYLLFTYEPHADGQLELLYSDPDSREAFAEKGGLLACYDVELDPKGGLVSWRMIGKNEPAQFEKWYAYMVIDKESPWQNNQTYVNTLDKAAIERFIEITHERYYQELGEEFDQTIPSIFTDEPQFTVKTALKYATEKGSVNLPWTDDLPETYAKTYGGEDLLGNLPELIWDRADGQVSVVRYHYHDHVCERFASAFADTCGKWCDDHGLKLTGHIMREPSLRTQTNAIGEAMRHYRGFGLPGIDMLERNLEYTTAKQAQSAVHQFGREGMLSEMYGVANWDFDFREHKMNGDWMAALGVTIRVPHLSWVSMAGESKRDYPASIHYQSPWWEKYPLIEDHFARVNTAMTRGKPLVKVGVIHPIESYWLHWGPHAETLPTREDMDSNFQNMTKWLLFGGIDFDFISESLIPELCKEQSGSSFRVGKMEYDVILVPGCETLRSTTLERLETFRNAGGTLIFAGELPTLEDAVPSDRGATLAMRSKRIPFTRGAMLNAMEPARLVDIRTEDGVLTTNYLHQLREDKEGRWLFIARGTIPHNRDMSRFQNLKIRLAGAWKVSLYNTANGEVETIRHIVCGDSTTVFCRMYDYDSLLLWMEPASADTESVVLTEKSVLEKTRSVDVPITVPYTLSEPNALLLDQAEYALDDGEWQPSEEILRLDDLCREKLGWLTRRKNVIQPWAKEEEKITHTIHLRWRIYSEIDYVGAQLAMEDAERVTLGWNGKDVPNTVLGWYADKSIKTVALPPIVKGENILEASIPFGNNTNVEWVYLLGNFGTFACGRVVRIVDARKELAFGDITKQGLTFYGGNITYHIPIETKGGDLQIRSSQYKGIMQSVTLDDGQEYPAIYPPYTVRFDSVKAGKHTLHITLYGHRRNGFGPVHLANLKETWIGPQAWRTTGEAWCYDYKICEEGILTTPEIWEIL
jgi:hypothetical protein